MPDAPRDRPHLHVQGSGESENYTSPRRGGAGLPPARTRAAHAARLEQALGVAIAGAHQQLAARDDAVAEGERGFSLEFEVPIEHQAALDGLENRPKKIELVAVRPPGEGDEVVTATVFVPEAAADYFSAKVEQYRAEDTPGGKPRNENLVARIDGVRLGAVRSLFTDSSELFPPAGRAAWWRYGSVMGVWLRCGQWLPVWKSRSKST